MRIIVAVKMGVKNGGYLYEKTRKLFAAILIVLIVISTVPVSGLIEAKLPWVNLDGITNNGGSVIANAASNSDLRFELNEDGASYYVTGASTNIEGALVIPEKYNNKPVTVIRNNAFAYCKKLTSVKIPDSITTIADEAFSYCSNLKSIVIPDNVTSIGHYAFLNSGIYFDPNNWSDQALYIGKFLIKYSGPEFEESHFPFSIKSGTVCIADGAFSDNDCLNKIIIPDTVKIIGESAFYNCSNISELPIPDSVEMIGSQAFGDCHSLRDLTIPKGVKSLGERAFLNCSSLIAINVSAENSFYSSVDGVLFDKNKTKLICYPCKKAGSKYMIPDTVLTVEENAFERCEELQKVDFSAGITNIGSNAFMYCENLSSVTIPNGVTSIGKEAFSYCSNLKNIELPDTLVKIGCSAFSYTNYYKNNNNWTSGVLYIGKHLISSNSKISSTYSIAQNTLCIADNAFEWVSSLTKIVIPDSVVAIGNDAFMCCINLVDISLPKSITAIGNGAFFNCTSLTKVIIPENVTDIGEFAFNSCNSLTKITIPDSVKTIECGAFLNCKKLNSVIIPSSVIAIGDKAFGYINNTKITSFKIFGTAGSEAEKYAKSNKFAFVSSKPGLTTLKSIANTAGGVKITWAAEVNAEGYYVYRKTTGGWSKIATITNNTVSFTDKNVKCGASYTYTVKAYNCFGNGLYSSKGISIKYTLSQPNVSVKNVSSGVMISWSRITGATGYLVYRKAGGAKSWSRIATINKNEVVSFKDKNVKSGTNYKYTVKAYCGKSASTYMSGVSTKYLAQPKVSVSNASKSITVKWNKIGGATGYLVYRKAGGASSWSRIATITKNQTISYTDKNVLRGTNYKYTVKAYYGKICSSYTSGITIMHIAPTVINSVVSGKSGITLKFNRVSEGTGYIIYRKTTGEWTKLATVKGNSNTTFVDKSAKKGTTYTYTIKAYNGSYKSAACGVKTCKDKY